MAGERDLTKLLQNVAPVVHPEVFVYCCFPDFQLPASLTPVASFREVEGLTAIVPLSQAQALGIHSQFESRMISLTVQSALDAVGFLARITAALAAQGIPCNVVSAYYHDHLFVPMDRLEATLQVLNVPIQVGEGP